LHSNAEKRRPAFSFGVAPSPCRARCGSVASNCTTSWEGIRDQAAWDASLYIYLLQRGCSRYGSLGRNVSITRMNVSALEVCLVELANWTLRLCSLSSCVFVCYMATPHFKWPGVILFNGKSGHLQTNSEFELSSVAPRAMTGALRLDDVLTSKRKTSSMQESDCLTTIPRYFLLCCCAMGKSHRRTAPLSHTRTTLRTFSPLLLEAPPCQLSLEAVYWVHDGRNILQQTPLYLGQDCRYHHTPWNLFTSGI
jgi:hypothetical protein